MDIILYKQIQSLKAASTNATNLSSGTINTARLGSGTANSTTYLRGDNTWQTISSGSSVTISDDIATNTTYYPAISTVTSGTATEIKTSSTKLTFNPSTGTLGATLFSALSDQNFKTNISSLNDNYGVSLVDCLRPVSFDWKDNGKSSLGVIAQEIEIYLPELVNDIDGVKSVEYNGLIAILLKAVQELSARVKELEEK